MEKETINHNFSQPTRQSYVAILLILYRVYTRFIKQFWYIIIPFIIGKKSSSVYFLYFIVAVAILLGIYAIIDFYRYKFYIEGKDFIVKKGVFSRRKIVIPFERIQSINFKQNIIQQMFQVVGLEIDTAGTSKKEFDFDALNLSTGNELRDFIFLHKKQNSISLDDNIVSNSIESNEQLSPPVVKLSVKDLIKIGFTQNHFRSLFFALLSMFWILDQLEQLGIDTASYAGNITEENILQLGIMIITGVMIFVIIAIIIISIVRNILRYFNFLLRRIPNGFKLEYGLFNRNEISIMDNKVQVLRWSDNLLRRALGLFTLNIKLASSVVVKQKKAILVPGITVDDVEAIKQFYFPNQIADIHSFAQTDPYYLWRRIIIVVLVFSGLSIITWQIENLIQFESILPLYYIPILLLCYFSLTSFIKFNKMKYGINGSILQINDGIFGNKHSLYTLYKLQGVKLTESPIQKRKSLANLIIYSAAGNQTIKYIDKSQAKKLRDYILYRIESDHRDWM